MWLVGKEKRFVPDSALPSRSQVLALFGFYYNIKKLTIVESARNTANDIISPYSLLSIATLQKSHVTKNAQRLWKKWCLLKKNMNRKMVAEKNKQSAFEENLKTLFPVMRDDAVDMTQNEFIKDFIIKQKESHSPLRMTFLKKRLSGLKFKKREIAYGEKMQSQLGTNHSDDSPSKYSISSNMSSCPSDLQYVPPQYSKKRGTENPAVIFDTKCSLSLDRAKISDRKAALVLPTIAHALGHDATKLPTSFSSIRRARQMQLLTEAEKIKDTFSPISPLTPHWDSKLLSSAPGIYSYYPICNSVITYILEICAMKLTHSHQKCSAFLNLETITKSCLNLF